MKLIVWLIPLLFISNLFAEDNPQKIYLFYSTDLRGGIEPQQATYMNPNFPPKLGGGAAAQGILKKYRAIARREGDAVLLLDGGNTFTGSTAIGTASDGTAILDYMNMAGYDGMVLGNDDFSLGSNQLVALAEKAQFPILAANVLVNGKQTYLPSLLPQTIIEKNGIKIGLFGIVSKAAEQTEDAASIAGIHFTAEVSAAEEAVKTLKALNADLIIGLAYLGLPYDAEEEYQIVKEMEKQNVSKRSYVTTMDLVRQVPGIDILISGGFNRGYQEPWEDPVNHTICFQNYASGGNLGMAVLHIDRKYKKISGYELAAKEQGLLLLSEDEFWPDPQMADSIRALQETYVPDFDKILGVTHTSLTRSSQGESPMSNLMCDAMRESTGADFAFNNFSGMRRDIAIGPITPRDLSGVFPFGNKIVLVSVKGDLLKELVENTVVGSFAGLAISGGEVHYNNQYPDGNKITYFSIGGAELAPQKTYKIATTTYLAEGNSGMSKLAFLPDSSFEYSEILVRDAVASYIKSHSPLEIRPDGRWKKK